MKIAPISREALLEQAFSDIPSEVAGIALRPLSAGSFTLLGRLGNPMIVEGNSPAKTLSEMETQAVMFAAAIQYIWIHSAPLEEIFRIQKLEDVPEIALKELHFSIPLGQAFAFLARYQASALRMTASLAETEPEDDRELGKPENPPTSHAGLPVSSMPAVPAEIQFGRDTSSGSCPSSEPFPTSTPQTEPTEPSADGPSLTCLTDLAEEVASF